MKERGFTLVELLIVVAVIGVIAAIAIPSMLRAPISANESNAVASLRTINSAQASYASGAGGGGYATALATLGVSCPGSTVSFISADLMTDPSVKSGYRFVLQASAGANVGPADCNGTATRSAYYATTVPLSLGVSGHRALSSNAAGAIYFRTDGVPPTEAQMAPGGGGQVIQ